MKKSELFFAFILLPIDVAMILVAFVFAYYFRINLEVVPAASSIPVDEYLRYALYILPVWVALLALNGLYYIKTTSSTFTEFYKIFNASSTAMLFLVVGIFFYKITFFSRLILLFTWILSIVLIAFGRLAVKLIQKYLLKYGIGRRNVVLIGDNSTTEYIVQNFAKSGKLEYKFCGVLNGTSIESKYGLKIIGSLDDLPAVIKKYNLDDVVLTDIGISKAKIMQIIQICSDHNITFKYIPDTFSFLTLNVSAELIGTMPVMELKSIPLDGWGRIVKRILDLTFAALGLIITSPLFLLIAILEKTLAPGPVFYSHERVGRDEKLFSCHKFRSMYMDKCDFSKGGSKWTTAKDSDDRITPLGKFLRKTNLDELPQLWNILVGEMSFIGPRPEQPKFVEKFEREIPDYFRRHRVKAGLTGWAQVNGLKGDTSIKERVRYDMYYIENWSLWLDIKIIIKTVILFAYEAIAGKYEYRTRP